jgi:hypothetical protein
MPQADVDLPITAQAEQTELVDQLAAVLAL